MKKLLVVRIRGRVVPKEVNETLKYLNLKRKFSATVIDDKPAYLGMVKKVNSYIAWGEVDKETIALLLRKRGRLIGDKKLTDNYLKENSSFESIDSLADALFKCKCTLKDTPNLKRVFRLSPPRKGFKKSTKKGVADGGILGYHSEKINELVKKMI